MMGHPDPIMLDCYWSGWWRLRLADLLHWRWTPRTGWPVPGEPF